MVPPALTYLAGGAPFPSSDLNSRSRVVSVLDPALFPCCFRVSLPAVAQNSHRAGRSSSASSRPSSPSSSRRSSPARRRRRRRRDGRSRRRRAQDRRRARAQKLRPERTRPFQRRRRRRRQLMWALQWMVLLAIWRRLCVGETVILLTSPSPSILKHLLKGEGGAAE